MQYDLSTCKLCNHTDNTIKYRLRMANVFICDNCQFHYTDYLDSEYEALSAHSQLNVLDTKTVDYIENKLQSNTQRFEHHVQTVLKNQFATGNRLLDVGFGGAVFLKMIQQQGYDCYGIELDFQYMLYAKERLHLEHVYDKPLQDDFWQLHHQNFFDTIVLWDVIEHVNFPKQIMESASRLLKQGGRLFIDTPCRDGFYHKFGAFTYKISGGKYPTFLHSMYSNHRFGHKQILSKKDIHFLLDSAGLKLVSLQQFHEMSFPYEFYLRKMISNKFLLKLAIPLTTLFFKVFRIKNKMMIVAEKR